MLAQYKLNSRRVLEYLRAELSANACVVYHKNDEAGVAEFIIGHLPGVIEGEANSSLDSIVHLVLTGGCNHIVTDVSQTLYRKHNVFHEHNLVAVASVPLTGIDELHNSIVVALSFNQNTVDWIAKQSLLEFCAAQLNVLRENYLQNINDVKAIESLTEQAYQDSMTGLLNRNGWEAEIAVNIANGFSDSLSVSVFVVDVNNLKILNDTHGHAAGDLVICQVATVLKKYFSSEQIDFELCDKSFVARTGGDEYMGLLFDSDDVHAQIVSSKITDELSELGVSVSIGISCCTNSNKLPDAILNADEAMYEQKTRIHSGEHNLGVKLKLAS